MNMYFAGSITGGREDVSLYAEFIDFLRQFGNVFTEHIGSSALTATGESTTQPSYIHDRDIIWLTQADLIVAEVSTPSLGVGYELGVAVERGKRIVCLYREGTSKRLSAMIRGCAKMTTIQYTAFEDAKVKLKNYILSSFALDSTSSERS